jgi:glycosyltransferase involved in cell wall biosynthesis
MTPPYDLSVLHIGAARYQPRARDHVTYGIWRELAAGFREYHVVGRSTSGPASWSDGNLHVTLIPSRAARELEFLLTQLKAVPLGLSVKPDVIVCQSPALGGLAAIRIARRTGARVLMEMHGMEFFVPTRPGSRLWALQQICRFALRRATLVRVLSPRMGDRLVELYGDYLKPRIRVLPPRVNLSDFSQQAAPRESGPLRLVMVGAVNGNKGQRRLIRALANVAFPVELHIVGGGPDLEATKKDATGLAAEGSNLHVVAHGRLSHSAVADALGDADILVQFSVSEGTPRAIMEAMAIGLPVVTTDAGFCADIVQHGREGFVLGPDPDSEIVEVLERFRNDPGTARRMGAAGRERAEREFDSVRLFDEYRRLIAETAAS